MPSPTHRVPLRGRQFARGHVERFDADFDVRARVCAQEPMPALMGALMCMGVATANSILVVSFATDRLVEHGNASRAAIEAGGTRFRPVVMTALAMIIGMVPMALGLGQGGEQNAPLGRAVIGGLVFATIATLLFVPTVFRLIHGRRDAPAGVPGAFRLFANLISIGK